jgi:hypothetical protein
MSQDTSHLAPDRIYLVVVKAKWIVRALALIAVLLITAYMLFVSGQLIALMIGTQHRPGRVFPAKGQLG